MVDTPEKPLVVTPHTDVTKRRSDWGGKGPPQRENQKISAETTCRNLLLNYLKYGSEMVSNPYRQTL